MPELFDARSQPEARSADDLLRDLQKGEATRQLRGALDDLRELVDTWRAEEADKPVEPGIVAALEAITGAADAPLTYRSLHRRVHEGRTTWADFWHDPRAEADGPIIVGDVVRFNTVRLRAVLDDIDRHEDEQVELDHELDAEIARQAAERRDDRSQDRRER